MSGTRALAHGEPSEELERLNASLGTDPNQVALLLKRADIHSRYQHFEKALDDLRKAKSLSPDHDQIGFLIGRLLAKKGDFSQAEIELNRFLESSRSSIQAQVELARVLHAQQKYLASADAYDQVIALQKPPLPEHYLSRAEALLEAGVPHLDKALAGIEEGMVEMGPLIVLQRVAIDINRRQGNLDAALNRVDQILQGIQRKESWLFEKARILLDMGHHEKAREQLVLAQTAVDSLPHRIRNSAAMIELRNSIKKLMNPNFQLTRTNR